METGWMHEVSGSKIKVRSLLLAGILWLALPVIMFFWGWLHWPIALIGSALILWSVYSFREKLREFTDEIPLGGQTKYALFIVFIAVLISGIGGFSPQMEWDHGFRNAVFNDLVNYRWPVEDNSGGETRLLCYYFCFWLPAAGVAKLFGSALVGNIFMLLYAYIGMSIVFLLFSRAIGKLSVIIALLFFSFCTWDLFVYAFTHPWNGLWQLLIAEKDPASNYFGAASPIHNLFFAYNHGIAAWLGFTLVWYFRRRVDIMVFLLGLLCGFAPIPAVGVAPVIGYQFFRHLGRSIKVGTLTGIFSGIIFALFMTTNAYGGAPGLSFSMETAGGYFYEMVIFVLFTYCPFLPFIWKDVKKDSLFWGLLICQLGLSCIRIGTEYDFGWRVGMSFMCYFIFIIFRRIAAEGFKNKWLGIVLGIGIFSGSWIGYQWVFHIYLVEKNAPSYNLADQQSTYRADWLGTSFNRESRCYNNFVVDNPDSFFTRYLLRDEPEE